MNKILQWALVLAIMIVLNLFFNYTIQLVYDEPRWEDFCPVSPPSEPAPETAAECVSRGGVWSGEEVMRPQVPKPVGYVGYCDLDFQCRQDFETADKLYRRNVFVILVAAGLVSLAAGLLSAVGAVSLGLSFGGVVSFIIASVRYWSDMDDYLRVIILAAALIILIWLGLKKFRQ
ncbi:MAG: hypothetical protein HYT46_00935 [Candidatus Vogelbacteria bacterium]|nr:hypothetical protein [Candidatus Vogelbacteria bacterium]